MLSSQLYVQADWRKRLERWSERLRVRTPTREEILVQVSVAQWIARWTSSGEDVIRRLWVRVPPEMQFVVVLTQTTGLLNHLKPLLCYVPISVNREENCLLGI